MDVLGRYRNLIVLVGVLFAQILGLAVQVNVKRTTDSEPTRLIRIWAVGIVTPLEKALVWTETSTAHVWHNYFYLRGVRAENRSLKAQIERMNLEQVRIAQDADQARRLQALLAFKEQFISGTVAAQVIGGSGSEQSRLIYIDKGYNDGIRPDMAVITADGVVGKVLHADTANRHVAQVLLIDDQTSGVGALLDKTRLQGILRGTPSGEVVLEKVMSDETVPAGERVLTSGGDGIFPKGLVVGQVTKVTPGGELFLNIHVRPAADLSRLEEVLVVTKIDERQAEPDQTGAARAVDILAARLPGVPSKPEDGKNGVPTGTVPNTGTTNQPATPNTTAPTSTTPTATTKPGAAAFIGPTPVVPKAVAPANNGSDTRKPKVAVPQAPPPTPQAAASGSAKTATAASETSSRNPAAVSSGPSAANRKATAPSDTSKVRPNPVKAEVKSKLKPAVEDSPH
jgi:rod shape-determining protein MreC